MLLNGLTEMNSSNVVRLAIEPDTKIAGDLVASARESIEAHLRVTVERQSRSALCQALVHLHEAELLLSEV
jgi:hypothetical protein